MPRAERPALAAFLLLFAALPLLWPTIPPLLDVPNHISRYAIGLDYASSADFRRWFEVRHVLVGNLGADLIAGFLGKWIGVELAVKLIAIAIPVLSVAGIALIAREVHGRVTAFTALPAIFAYNFPFSYGFLNYTLSMSMTLIAFGVWLRMGRSKRTRLRAAIFLPVGFGIWLCHMSGWGMLGLMIFSWEVADARTRGIGWGRAILSAAAACLALTAPLIPMALWSSHIPGEAIAVFHYDLGQKFAIFFMSLRDGNELIDAVSMLLLCATAVLAHLRQEMQFDRRLVAVAGVLIATYIAMPPNIIGSAYADMRIAPYALMIALLAIRPIAQTAFTRRFGAFALSLFAAQMLYHTANYFRLDRIQQQQLEALDHIPVGSSVFGLAEVSCGGQMAGYRLNHLHRLAISRRHAFANGSWAYPSTQTVLARDAMTAGYVDDGSSFLEPSGCIERPSHTIDGALAELPRDRFRYLWLLNVPSERWPARPWLHPVWRNQAGILYRIDPDA